MINWIRVTFEDNQADEMEKNSLGQVALETVLRETFSCDLFELRKKKNRRKNAHKCLEVKSILEIQKSVWKGLYLGKKLGCLQNRKEITLTEDLLCTSDHGVIGVSLSVCVCRCQVGMGVMMLKIKLDLGLLIGAISFPMIHSCSPPKC